MLSDIGNDLLFIANEDDITGRIDQGWSFTPAGYPLQKWPFGSVARHVSQDVVNLPFRHLLTYLCAVLAPLELIEFQHIDPLIIWL